MKKFMELMRRPVTLGEFMVFCIGFAGSTWLWANDPDPVEYAKVIKEKAKKKGYTTVKPVGSDGWYNPEYYNQEEK